LKHEKDIEYFKRFARWKATIYGLALLLFTTVLLSINIGFVQIPFLTVLEALANVPLGAAHIQIFHGISQTYETIVLEIRLPRILAGILVGSALAGSGVTFQAVFRNPMADPYVLGVSAGAAAGGASAIVLGFGRDLLGSGAISLLAWIGALATSFAVYNIARVGGRTPVMTLLLSGIAVSVFLSAIVDLLLVLSNPYTSELQVLVFWLLGSVAYTTWGGITIAVVPIICGLLFLTTFSRQLNIMLLGDDEAQHLGVETEVLKRRVLMLSSVVTASAVALGGIIGFVGLMIPHIVRILVGPDHRVLLPCSILAGAIYLTFFDALARVIYSPAEFPVGILTAVAGGPFFLYLLKTKKRDYSL
jgi:iron complex transport system permease protein